MKKTTLILGSLLLGSIAFGQHGSHGAEGCDCPSCLEKAASGKTFTLPGLQGLEQPDEHAECNHTHEAEEIELDEHAGHDHGDEPAEADEHAGHNHGEEEGAVDEHAGHAHGVEVEGGIEITSEMADKIGLQVHEAEGGSVAKTVTFPAEIKLNRDRTVSISPRYASIVKSVKVEIGEIVREGDVLVELENRDTLASYKLKSPISGVVISKDVAIGESAGDTHVLFEVADLSSVWADISIFPRYQHLLRKGMPVEFVAHDGHTARGSVKYISPLISLETRTFTARCILKGADEDFTPGAFVRARIKTETAEVAVRVEREAIQMMEGEPVLFIPKAHGFQTVEVVLGLADDQNVEIKSGLKSGDRYVAVGAFALKAQMVTSGMDPHAGHGH